MDQDCQHFPYYNKLATLSNDAASFAIHSAVPYSVMDHAFCSILFLFQYSFIPARPRTVCQSLPHNSHSPPAMSISRVDGKTSVIRLIAATTAVLMPESWSVGRGTTLILPCKSPRALSVSLKYRATIPFRTMVRCGGANHWDD